MLVTWYIKFDGKRMGNVYNRMSQEIKMCERLFFVLKKMYCIKKTSYLKQWFVFSSHHKDKRYIFNGFKTSI